MIKRRISAQFLRFVKTMLLALVLAFVGKPVFADSFFANPNDSLMCTYDALGGGEDAPVVFSAMWCEECTDLANKTSTCNLTVSDTTGECSYSADCKPGYKTLVEENTANVHCSEMYNYNIIYHNVDDVVPAAVNDPSNPSSYTVEDADIVLHSADRNGYTFNGWYSEDIASQTQNENFLVTQIGSGSVGDVDLYAGWTVIPYSIYYDLDGGVASNLDSYNIETPTFTVNNPEKSGYDFDGWCVNNTDCENDRVSTYTVNQGSTGNIYLDAYWTLHGYTISYNLDGGVADNPTRYTTETPTFTLENPTKRGYEFDHWCENSFSCSNPQNTYTITQGSVGDLDLYATWNPKRFNLTYACGNGVSPNSSWVYFNDTFTRIAPFCTQVGKTQTGWTCTSDDEDQSAIVTTFATGIYTIDGDSTCLPQWDEKTYTIIYKDVLDNGTIVTLSDLEEHYTYSELQANSGITITAEPEQKNGYTFNGWCKNSDRTQCKTNQFIEYVPNVEPEATTVFYADWKEINYDISYELNGGENHVDNPYTYTINSPTIVLKKPERNGFVFAGWFEREDFSGGVSNEIPNGSTGAKTFYAKWEAQPYTIIYNLNYGEFEDGVNVPRSYTIDMESDLVLPEPIKAGYDFGGWYKDSDLTNGNYTVITKGSYGDLIFYAKWTEKVYKVQYLCNVGEGYAATDTVRYTENYSLRSNICGLKTGYTFNKWICKKQTDNEIVENVSTNSWYINSDLICEPDWQANKYTVVFDANTGVGSKPNKTCTYNAENDCDITNNNEITKQGYDFVGWVRNATDDITSAYLPNESNKIVVPNLTENAETIRLYALWAVKNITCENGYYLPASSVECQGCKSGYYCPEGTWTYNTEIPQGNLSCATLLGVLSAGSNPLSYRESDCFAYCPYRSGYVTNQSYTAEETSSVCVYPATIEYVDIEDSETCPQSSLGYTWPTNSTVTLCNVPQSRVGYTFAGYRDNNNKEYRYNGSAIVVDTSKLIPHNNVVTMTGIWNSNNSTITYKCNNPAATVVTENVVYHNSATLLDMNTCQNTGNTFDGWLCVGTSGTVYINKLKEGTLVVPDENVVCTAQWLPYKYKIEFNPGATNVEGTMAPTGWIQYNQEPKPTLPANQFTRFGYEFYQWCDNVDDQKCVGRTFADEAAVKNLTAENEGVVTLTAMWKLKNYNITYVLNGGTLRKSNPSTYNITTPTFTLNNPTQSGYSFLGWCEGSASCEEPQTSYVFTQGVNAGDKTLYAKFEKNKYTITYKDVDANGNEYVIEGLEPVEYDVTQKIVYPTEVPASNHHHEDEYTYRFVGWYKDKALTEQTTGFVAGATGNKTVYAKWTNSTPTGTIEYICGSKRTITRSGYVGETVNPATMSECGISNTESKTFVGWRCGETVYGATETLRIAEEPITCETEWLYVTYTITYKDVDADGNEYVIEGLEPTEYNVSQKVMYPTEVSASQHHHDDEYTYKFVGWYKEKTLANSTTGFVAGSTGNRTVYAKWSNITPTGTIKYICGNKRTITRSGYVGDSVTPASESECGISADTLEAWVCGETEYSLDTNMTIAEGTLTCNVKIKEPEPEELEKYTITYKDVDANGNEYDITGLEPAEYDASQKVMYPTEVPASQHHHDDEYTYKFVGWYKEKSLTNSTTGFVAGSTGDRTVYAKWSNITPTGTIKYDCGNRRTITRSGYVGDSVTPASASECGISNTSEKTLVGWKCGNTVYSLTENLHIEETTITCVTEWQYKKYTIIYKDVDANENEYDITGLEPAEYDASQKVMYPTEVPASQHHHDDEYTYKFVGWYKEKSLTNSTTGFVAGSTGDRTVYAKWSNITPTGTIKYDCGNRRTITRSGYVGDSVTPASASECGISADTLTAWTCEGTEYALNNNMIIPDGTLLCSVKASSQEPNPDDPNTPVPSSYTITYMLNGGSWQNASGIKTTFTETDSFDLSTDITKQNSIFAGWYSDSGFVNSFNSVPAGTTHNITVYAKWTTPSIDCEKGHYLPSSSMECAICETENYYCPGGTYQYSTTTDQGMISCPSSYPYADAGSEARSACYRNCAVRNNYTVSGLNYIYRNTCVYTPTVYHINYELDGGEFEENANVVYEYTIETPIITTLPTPKRNGRLFDGWLDSNGTSITGIDTSLATDITLYAQWIYGPCDKDNYMVELGTCLPCPEHSYSDDGYSETCVCNDGYVKDGSGACVIQEYTITYLGLNGADNSANPTTYTVEDIGTRINALSDIKGYWFNRWTRNGNTFTTLSKNSLGDLELTAIWSAKIVHCESGEYLPAGEDVCQPCESGYYCPDATYYNYDEDDDQGLFECPNGYDYSDENATNENQCFKSCPEDANAVSITGEIHKNGTNTCKYKYAINYVLNGGHFDNTYPTSYEYGSGYVTLITPEKEGYTFAGWYQTPDFRDSAVTRVYRSQRNTVTLYAKWIKGCESGAKLHVGDNLEVCLSLQKETSPAFVVRTNHRTYYLKMAENENLTLTPETTKKMRVEYNGRIYNVYDYGQESGGDNPEPTPNPTPDPDPEPEVVYCPENSTYDGTQCVCNTGYERTNNQYNFKVKTPTYSANGYNFTANATGIGEIYGESLGWDRRIGEIDASVPAGTYTGKNCWCRIVAPFETRWTYSGGVINGSTSVPEGTDAWFTACSNRCANRTYSATIQSIYGMTILDSGEVCRRIN